MSDHPRACRRRRLRGLFFFLTAAALAAQIALLLLGPAALPALRGGGPEPWVEPATAALLVAPDTEPPAADAPWRTIALPDNWRARGYQPPPGAAAWYRIACDVPGDRRLAGVDGGWAVYVPYLYDGGRFWLNGQRLAHLPEPDAQVHVKWERPHLLRVPDLLLRAGRNELLLRTAPGQSVAGDLAVPRILAGPELLLRPLYERRLFWVRTVPPLTSGACFVIALLMLFIWVRRRDEALYGLFGLTALFWGVRTLTFVIELLPQAQWDVWRTLYQAATGGFVASLTVFGLYFGGLYRPWAGRALLGYALAGPALLLASRGAADGWVSTWWMGGFVVLGMIVFIAVTYAAWVQRSAASIALMSSVWITMGSGFHDYLLLVSADWQYRLAPEWIGARVFIFHVAANAVLLVMGGILASRFVDTLGQLEALNQTLEERVARREALLQRNYAQLAALERGRAEVAERRRIMQDMHDGLGSQLFTSLSRTERQALTQDEMTETLRACIAEMRLAIESLAPEGDDPLVAFGDFRFRLEAQLQAAGVASEWQGGLPEELPPHVLAALSPHVMLQVLRVLQEALTNALKHGRPRRVQVRLGLQDNRLFAEVEDDGAGLPPVIQSGGRGLGNMRARARRIGARLRWSMPASGRGTLVRLDWSLPS
ncbi:sensor histidine kinase [Xylophilus sp.]|uniref:sensor histidine kinase n=1 Tax=Xylophilus sp. TaxID=2653893 RepID=UPI0013B86132|nr:ATP-binding protein [Xylophilus sp.]KAF1046648.1 MAG: Signal transduction histidine-protein kinase/phosphatase UhpB [Xylophilus sp.]